VVFVIRRDFQDAFEQLLGDRFSQHIEVAYAFQELTDLPPGFSVPPGREKPWGTAHAIYAARHEVDTPFAVQNADDFYGNEAYSTMAGHLPTMPEKEACMVGYQLARTLSEHGSVSRGVCALDGAFLQDIVERLSIVRKPDGSIVAQEGEVEISLQETDICSMNFWGFPLSFFDVLESRFTRFLEQHGNELKSEWLIPSVVDEQIKSGSLRVRVLPSEATWFGVTYPQDRPWVVEKLRAMHDAGIYPPRLWD
jgi:NDP-sugar pyrophosphorylase family protein